MNLSIIYNIKLNNWVFSHRLEFWIIINSSKSREDNENYPWISPNRGKIGKINIERVSQR